MSDFLGKNGYGSNRANETSVSSTLDTVVSGTMVSQPQSEREGDLGDRNVCELIGSPRDGMPSKPGEDTDNNNKPAPGSVSRRLREQARPRSAIDRHEDGRSRFLTPSDYSPTSDSLTQGESGP